MARLLQHTLGKCVLLYRHFVLGRIE
mgnify:CR=1